MGKFIAGFVVSTVVFFGFALSYAQQERSFIDATCVATQPPSNIYLESDADRELVCRYLCREVGLDQ